MAETERRQIATGQVIVTPHKRLDIVLNGGYDNSKLENDSYENSALDRTIGFAYGNWSEYNSRNYNVGRTRPSVPWTPTPRHCPSWWVQKRRSLRAMDLDSTS